MSQTEPKYITNDEYRAMEGWSSTQIKSIVKHSVQKALIPIEDSDALRAGRAFHTMMESDQAFNDAYAVFDDTDIVREILSSRPNISVPSMTKEYKKAKADFESENLNKEIVSLSDYQMYVNMRSSALGNETVDRILGSAVEFIKEPSYFCDFYSHHHKITIKARPDVVVTLDDGSQYIIDWKSCRDASPRGFKSDFFKYRYDVQALVYSAVTQVPVENFLFVAIEKEYPFLSAVYGLSDEAISSASDAFNDALEKIAQYELGNDKGLLNQGITWI